jgi:hypothetical protein
VACVLRSGGVYTPAWVEALARGVSQFLPGARFICLSDMAVPGVEVIPLLHDWPGWWSKIELFRPGVFPSAERIFYLDLDSIVTGDLAELASYDGPFAMLQDFYHAARPASGVMAWQAGFGVELYERFRRDPVAIMECHRRFHPPHGGGDQAFIAETTIVAPDRWQHRYPGQIVSFKAHCRKGVPPGARIVCFHGRPKPSIPGVFP